MKATCVLFLHGVLFLVCNIGFFKDSLVAEAGNEVKVINKRYARLSSGPWSSYRTNNFGDIFKRYKMPWLFLPNNGMCFRKRCRSNRDCCRRYNICDKWAKVCYDCWYGHPCRSSGDCCERYPNCKSYSYSKACIN